MNSTHTKTLLIGIALIVVIVGFSFYRNTRTDDVPVALSANQEDVPTIAGITPQDLDARLRETGESLRVIDVRPADDFAQLHVIDSVNIPIGTIAVEQVLSAAEDVVVLIDDGRFLPEHIFVTELARRGGRDVLYVQGGIAAWDRTIGRTISIGDPDSFVDHAKVQSITPEELVAILQDRQKRRSYELIDVQSVDAFVTAHIPGAKSLPLENVERFASDTVSLNKTLVVYGDDTLAGFQGGVRLHDLNYFSVFVLDGGLPAWKEKGFPLIEQ